MLATKDNRARLIDASRTYDAQGRLSSATASSVTTTYSYDDGGIRYKQTAGGQSTLFLVDANNPTGYAQVIEQGTVA